VGHSYWVRSMNLAIKRDAFLGAHAAGCIRRLTFELSGRRRQDARPGAVKMYGVPPARAWWPAVGAPLERGVRPHFAQTTEPEVNILIAAVR
jgi:hypothetical protein